MDNYSPFLSVPGAELLFPEEFSSMPYLLQKVSLLESQLGQQKLNQAALQAQGAAPKLLLEVGRAIGRTQERLDYFRNCAETKATYRDALISSRARAGQALPAPAAPAASAELVAQTESGPEDRSGQRPVRVKAEHGTRTAAVGTAAQSAWYDTHQRRFVTSRDDENSSDPSLYDIPEFQPKQAGPAAKETRPTVSRGPGNWPYKDLDQPADVEPISKLRYSESPQKGTGAKFQQEPSASSRSGIVFGANTALGSTFGANMPVASGQPSGLGSASASGVNNVFGCSSTMNGDSKGRIEQAKASLVRSLTSTISGSSPAMGKQTQPFGSANPLPFANSSPFQSAFKPLATTVNGIFGKREATGSKRKASDDELDVTPPTQKRTRTFAKSRRSLICGFGVPGVVDREIIELSD